MRARNRKTGEIVNITSYKENHLKYYIHGVNSQGIEFGGEGDNFNEDFEFIENQDNHWEDVRERATIAALQGLLANPRSFYSGGSMKEGIVSSAVWKGYELVGRLKEEEKERIKEKDEVKEVNFENEFYDYSIKNGLSHKDIEFSDIIQTARFFFQLGLKGREIEDE